MSGARHLTGLLLRHARWMMPESRAAWAEAMERETHHIGNDREAMSWAIGCVFAAYADWFRSEQFLAPRVARLLLAVWCLQFALFYFYQVYFQLGQVVPPDMRTLYGSQPAALQALRSIAAALYLLAGLRLICNRQNALLPYGVALLISFTIFNYMTLPSQNAGGLFVLGLLPSLEWGIGPRFWFGMILPLMFGMAIWLMDHYQEEGPAAPRKLL